MKWLLSAVLTAGFVLSLAALEKKPLEKINLEELTEETLLDASRSKDHIAFVWYIPTEYWSAVISQNQEMGQQEKKRAMLTMQTLTTIAVVQGDVSPAGPITYYEGVFLRENLRFLRVDAEGKEHELQLLKTPSGEVKQLLEAIAPALNASIGTLGNHLQFFVFNDLEVTGNRTLDPYLSGKLIVELKRKNGRGLEVELNFPLNSLYIPRPCPNGKPAHVSWKFCPWTGTKLPE